MKHDPGLTLKKTDKPDHCQAVSQSWSCEGILWTPLRYTGWEWCENPPTTTVQLQRNLSVLGLHQQEGYNRQEYQECVSTSTWNHWPHHHAVWSICDRSPSHDYIPKVSYWKYEFNGPDDAVYARANGGGWTQNCFWLRWGRFSSGIVVHSTLLSFLFMAIRDLWPLTSCTLHENMTSSCLCLPPDMTHTLQPLDVAIIKLLKDHLIVH